MKTIKIGHSIIKHAAIPLTDIFLTSAAISDPYVAGVVASWKGIVASYGFMQDMLGREAKEFIEEVHENLGGLTKELYMSTEFRQSLQTTIEALIRTRSREKRKIIKQIYLTGYLQSEEKEKFELERLYATANQISLDAAKHLLFIEEKIVPIHRSLAETPEEMPTDPKPNRDWWLKRNLQRINLSKAVHHYLSQEYGLNSRKHKSYEPNATEDRQAWDDWSRKVGDEENDISVQFTELSTELISLGLFRNTTEGYTWTQYGLSFLKFLHQHSE